MAYHPYLLDSTRFKTPLAPWQFPLVQQKLRRAWAQWLLGGGPDVTSCGRLMRRLVISSHHELSLTALLVVFIPDDKRENGTMTTNCQYPMVNPLCSSIVIRGHPLGSILINRYSPATRQMFIKKMCLGWPATRPAAPLITG